MEKLQNSLPARNAVRPALQSSIAARTASQSAAPSAPQANHVTRFASLIKTYFATGRDAREWDDRWDTIHYGKQAARLTEPQTITLFETLRGKHTWRPSVAEVKTAVDELLESLSPVPDPNMGRAQARMYDAYALPEPERLQIAGRTTDDAIADARTKMSELRRAKPTSEAAPYTSKPRPETEMNGRQDGPVIDTIYVDPAEDAARRAHFAAQVAELMSEVQAAPYTPEAAAL